MNDTPITDIEKAVGVFQTAIINNTAQSADLRAQWLAIEKLASEARRAYLKMAMGDDNFSRGVSLVRKFAPIAFKYASTGGIGAAVASFAANSDSTTGFMGALKSVLGLG